MGILGAILVVVGGLFLMWWIVAAPIRQKRNLSASEGVVVEGKVVHLKEWLNEGHRRCQVEYVYQILDMDNEANKTLRGQSNCVPHVFDTLELDVPLKIRYLPQSPEFSRPLFDLQK